MFLQGFQVNGIILGTNNGFEATKQSTPFESLSTGTFQWSFIAVIEVQWSTLSHVNVGVAIPGKTD